ncbi:MAG: hypothetical protein K8S87_09520 [Planctomycetes bacterium]|nr:hypothetical protein [Planctomycetota bacterium]
MTKLTLRNALMVFAILSFIALPAFADGKVIFGGNLDRPVSTKEADLKESDNGANDEPAPDEPGDEEPEDPPTFLDEEIPGDTIVLALDRSGSMSSRHNPGMPIYDRNGNVIAYPTRWQAIQSETSNLVSALTEDDSFDIVTYATQIYVCFSTLREATPGNKAVAIGWIYSQGTTGCTNSYDALRAAFNNYGQVDTILFMSDGYPNTALSLGCGACACGGWIGSRILTDATGWIHRQIAMYEGFTFMVMQMGGSPMAFMQQLGSKPNSTFYLK